MLETNYFEELEKIANENIDVGDLEGPTMNEDPNPPLSEEEVEAIQAANAEAVPESVDEQLPLSPEETENLEEAVEQAHAELEAAKEAYASAVQNYKKMEKVAAELDQNLPTMAAFAQLLDYSTNEQVEEPLKKLAQERLSNALKNENDFVDVITKTAQELFESQDALDALYSDPGIEYVLDKLSSFIEDEEFSKTAADIGGVATKVRNALSDLVDNTKNVVSLREDVKDAKKALDEAQAMMTQLEMQDDAIAATGKIVDPLETNAHKYQPEVEAKHQAHEALQSRFHQGIAGAATAGALGAGGAYLGGKAIYNHMHPEEIEQVASDNVNINGNYDEGGLRKMANSIVWDFLKIAGAGGLLDIANNEQVDPSLRKEAADTFNAISRMGRRDMEESFVKVATQLYDEPVLHEVVAGYHTNELFDKIAFFTNANDMTADELEKVAGAEGVAAKGVAGALTDAKENIQAYIEEGKTNAETDTKQGNPIASHDSTARMPVLSNPEKYQVEKSAQGMLRDALIQKEAAWEAYVEAENFLRQNGY